jgi:hypothetical protein
MRSWRFHKENGEPDESPSIAEQIPEPHKEPGGDNTNPVAPRPVIKERHVDVNINVNGQNVADEHRNTYASEGTSSDTIYVPNESSPEWTESNSDATDLSREALESFNEEVNHSNYLVFNDLLQHDINLLSGNFRYARGSKFAMAGTEGFTSFISGAIDAVHAVISHITALFKTALFDGWRDFKRSELNFLCDASEFRVKRIYRLPYGDVSSVRIVTPQGMITPYPKTTLDSFACLDTLDMEEKSKNILAAADGILTNLHSDNSRFNAVVDDLRSDFLNRYDTDRAFDLTSKNFSDNSKDDEVLFQTQFKNMKEFQDTIELVSDKGNRYLQGVSSIHSRLEETEEIVTEICDVIKRKEVDVNVSRSQLDILSKAARAWAVLFDHYSVVINDVSRLDHNLTISVNRIIDTLHV